MEGIIDRILKLYKQHLDIDHKQEVILRYSLNLLISSIAGYALALLIAWALGIFSYVLVVMVTVSTLRVFSGGAHCSNAINCIVYGSITMNALGVLAKIIEFSTVTALISIGLIFFYGLWIVKKYAPADTPGKPISTKQKQDKLKKRSLAVVFIWFFIVLGLMYYSTRLAHVMIYASSIGILWQSFTLTKLGYSFCHVSDNLLSKVLIKKEVNSC